MHVRVDIAAVTTGSFAPVRLLKKNLGHSAQNFSMADHVNSVPFISERRIHQTVEPQYSYFGELVAEVL
jgi:hypothetical protein